VSLAIAGESESTEGKLESETEEIAENDDNSGESANEDD
jgi:hypothetical protein